eukprot:NODE_1833_length_1787_cov_21.008413_g1553_i0.p1 GENE.NODE_1833_length_1787_cov_21.008413_g1553_i0~~NODE_1833_length_1787_cov_21.008413_g1553_i0.p1  ORF type:complete len:387 (+),score=90.49 NODE_1833_length_1787_cov_21.008413_g1553_i0:68-1228(+)
MSDPPEGRPISSGRPARPRSALPGEKYEKLEIIGKGSFGNAVLVRDKRDGSKYISKEVNLQQLNAKDREAQRNEVDVLTKLKHPNIIKYIEHYEKDGTLCIIMEYADGGDLQGRIKKQKASGQLFSEDQIMAWFVQMGLAVKHIHDNKIIHRDLKSANIFLTSGDVVKLGDFGFGKILANTIAQAQTLCGTPYYFSPELCMGKLYNNKSDVWALGCILVEMCLLSHAFPAKNLKELMKRVTRGSYQPIPSNYSNDLKKLVDLLLTKDQVQRPAIKVVLSTDYCQAKIKEVVAASTLEQTGPQPELAIEETPEVKEMEQWVQQDAERNLHNAPAPNTTRTTPRRGEEAQAPPRLGTGGGKMGPVNRQQLADFLKGPPPEEVARLLQK